tara:strand:- start:475 stop:927 length:453 start_codon:yes stop_codon:yes gene_type:complete
MENSNDSDKKMFNKCDYLLIFLPMLAVYLPTTVIPFKDDIGKNVPFRPPGYVFGIVWPILLFLLGISWYLRRKSELFINFIYIFLTILLSIWYILYDINQYYGLINIILCFFLTIFLFFYKFNRYPSFLILPLSGWLIFASVLNAASIYY